MLAAAGAASGQPLEFDIRGPALQKDQSFVTSGVLKVTGADAEMARDGKAVKFKLTLTATLEEAVTVLDVAGGTVTKFQTEVRKDRVETAGAAKDARFVETSGLEKETIISARDGAKWGHKLAVGRPTEKQLAELTERGGFAFDAVPEGKLKPGHTWAADAAGFDPLLASALSDLKGQIERKFTNAEILLGEQVAVIKSSGKVSGRMRGNGDQPLDATIDLTHTAWRSVKTGLTMKASFAGTLTVTSAKGKDAALTITGPISGESTTKPVEKK
jgi:hypothetical protein